MSAQPQQYEFSKIFPLILDSWTAKTQPLIQLAQSQNAMETRPRFERFAADAEEAPEAAR